MIIEEEKVEIENEENISTNDGEVFEQVKQKHPKTWLIILGIIFAILLCLILVFFGIFTFYNHGNSASITKGVSINGIDVSNLDKEAAKERLKSFYQEQFSKDIGLKHNDYITYIKTSEIEMKVDIDSAVEEAYNIGKTGNILKDNFKVLGTMIKKENIYRPITFNEDSLKKILENLSPELPDAVIQSGSYIDGNDLIVTKGKTGYVIDIDSTFENIKQNIQNLNFVNNTTQIVAVEKSPKKVNLDKIYKEIHKEAKDAYFVADTHTIYPSETGMDFSIPLNEAKQQLTEAESELTIPLKVLEPNIKTTDLSQDAFPHLLSSFSTKYPTSNTNRTTNLRLAAEKINGYVLLPGETFSYNNVVGERTISAGYKEADIYENGQVVKGLGGGICQISTTLFNAALFANLEIVELYNHQFVPSYVKAGRDATVVYGVKDFKFKNSRNYAIKLTCSVENGTATFNIWGYKEDVEYDIDVYANITSSTSSYIKSSTFRTLKLNGEIVDRQNIMKATYKVH